MKEHDVDCMKYRKTTHLAGVDVDIITTEKGKCVLTIKDAYYDRGVNVSGNKTDGYFIEFLEDVKPRVVNSGNRKNIASIVKIKKGCTSSESRNLTNWLGTVIQLEFDESVMMMGKRTGGIVVSLISPIPDIDDTNARNILGASKDLNALKSNWSKLNKNEQALPSIMALKNKLKNTLK